MVAAGEPGGSVQEAELRSGTRGPTTSPPITSTSAGCGGGRAAGGEDIVDDTTRSPGRTASWCTSSRSVPYSRSYSSGLGGPRQLAGLADGAPAPRPRRWATGPPARTRGPRSPRPCPPDAPRSARPAGRRPRERPRVPEQRRDVLEPPRLAAGSRGCPGSAPASRRRRGRPRRVRGVVGQLHVRGEEPAGLDEEGAGGRGPARASAASTTAAAV